MTYKRETIVNIGALESAINFAYRRFSTIIKSIIKAPEKTGALIMPIFSNYSVFVCAKTLFLYPLCPSIKG